jgi:hypothetical protein
MSGSNQALDTFTAIVLADPALQWELRRISERATFVSQAVACARQHGCAIEAAEIEAALAAGLLAWRIRWTER